MCITIFCFYNIPSIITLCWFLPLYWPLYPCSDLISPTPSVTTENRKQIYACYYQGFCTFVFQLNVRIPSFFFTFFFTFFTFFTFIMLHVHIIILWINLLFISLFKNTSLGNWLCWLINGFNVCVFLHQYFKEFRSILYNKLDVYQVW